MGQGTWLKESNLMEKQAYTLRIFSFGYEFMQALRDEFKSRGNMYKYRFVQHPLNGQIDVQPIPEWYYPNLAGLIPNFSRRRLYLAVALEPYDSWISYRVVINLALDLNDQKLGIFAVTEALNKKVTVMADTTSVSYGTQSNVALKVLAKLREFMDDNGFGERKPLLMNQAINPQEEAEALRLNFFKNSF